jgi:hypothetical protein
MKKLSILKIALIAMLVTACADNALEVKPNVDNFPFRLILDAEEGGDLPDAEDYSLEIKFADFINDLPTSNIIATVDYQITNLSGNMIGAVRVGEVIYEEDDEEYAMSFTRSTNGLTGTITLRVAALNKIPEAFEVIFELPGEEDSFFASGGFTFSISNLQVTNGAPIILGNPRSFEYEVLDHELAGSWKYELDNEDDFNSFKDIFGLLNSDLGDLDFSSVLPGEPIEVEVEFEYEEATITITYYNEDGEEVEIEIEAEYDFEDGEIEFEGSYLIIGDDGEIEDELDFIIEGAYSINSELLTLTLTKIIDEDNFEDGEELYSSESGANFTFEKD